MDDIDRSSIEPYYLQLARILERQIRDGALAVGARLPGESELCRRYDLARSTVRETFRTLEQQRVIRVVPRRGAFVNDASENRWMLQVAHGFLEAHSPDARIATQVIRAEHAALPRAAAAALGLAESSEGFVLERLRRMNGVPAVHSTNWLPAPVAAALAGQPVLRGEASLNATLRAAGYHIFAVRREVAAIPAPPESAHRLEIARNAPLLEIRSVSRDAEGRPFDYYESRLRSDVVTVSVDAEIQGDAGG